MDYLFKGSCICLNKGCWVWVGFGSCYGYLLFWFCWYVVVVVVVVSSIVVVVVVVGVAGSAGRERRKEGLRMEFH